VVEDFMSEASPELKKQMEEFGKQKTGIQILAVFGFCCYLVGLFIANGFVLSKAWAWIIVPLFHFRTLGIMQSIAVMTALSLFTGQKHIPEGAKVGKFDAEIFIQPIATLLATLGFLWIFSRFI
jgi:hypothetical protein